MDVNAFVGTKFIRNITLLYILELRNDYSKLFETNYEEKIELELFDWIVK